MRNNLAKSKTLMLIPSVAKYNSLEAMRHDAHPRMDYFALQEALGADLLDYSSLESQGSPATFASVTPPCVAQRECPIDILLGIRLSS